MMQCGTTHDTFLRDNLQWYALVPRIFRCRNHRVGVIPSAACLRLSRATHWAKFTATASIGVIHKGHRKESMKLLGSYLPSIGSTGSPYSEGGALYAYGDPGSRNRGHVHVEYSLVLPMVL